jgi:5-formyltetrahydrofolate cyclo-ligase
MTAQAGGAAPSAMKAPADRDQLRREMRARRRALTDQELRRTARQLARVADRHLLLRPGRHIAFYFRHGAEADPVRLMELAHKRGCVLYVPVITSYRSNRMTFQRYEPGERLRANRYGIKEPELTGGRVAVRRLDLVFTPLLAFDLLGRRLGSGAGFYDRSLHHLRANRTWRRPRLIGVGFEFQRVHDELCPALWDVPVDAVLTEKTLYRTRNALKA